MQKAIDFEVKRQAALLLSGVAIEQETRRFDEGKKETVLMRKKTDAIDYKYFTEPNLVPIRLSEAFVEEAIRTCPELADSKMKRYTAAGLTKEEAGQMLQNPEMTAYFDRCMAIQPKRAKAYWNWLISEIAGYLNKNGLDIRALKVSPEHLDSLIAMIEEGTLSFNQARKVFLEMVADDEDPSEIADRLGLKQNSDADEIRKLVEATIEEFPQSVIDYKNGKDRAVGFWSDRS